jgi:hypothetical protein
VTGPAVFVTALQRISTRAALVAVAVSVVGAEMEFVGLTAASDSSWIGED